jgi:SAM-dependent methyltransferase
MQLAEVKPWGRSLHEYRLMFSLADGDLAGRVLGCGDGPASVNAELRARGGHRYVSVDPIYSFSGAEIEARVRETYDSIVSQVKENQGRYLWNHFPDPDAQGRARLEAMRLFLADYEAGKAEGRYLAGRLPELPFRADEFDLCLCSHLLFLYSTQLSLEFHLAALRDQLRVAHEVRVFPLFDLECRRSAHLDHVVRALTDEGFACELVRVAHEFQRGANEMLRVRRRRP